ncbi:uncharacterized protein LOC126833547 [Adelges cooleyi]|uniref:uncharacterized protein LOC126833547 n=1 Tax=Adelges cooleyi TaxID=133065 RepID=UPI00218058E0|nr:uncharacterized protein LOC126833547 [Adelges cooleyi]XP_050420920.1 uncharacterized protein LOC126833547 [Adelges cooleyi]
MSVCNLWATFKFSQIILCLSCLLYKRWADANASRLFYLLEKTSREWPLLNSITRNGAGSLFADVTFGGYVIICIALFIAYLMDELKNSKKTETFLLAIGAILFIAVGCLVVTTIDSIPENLIVNALVLSSLSIITGMVFILDICLSSKQDSDKKSKLPKNTRYGDIARTMNSADVVDSVRVNGTSNGHTNGIMKKETVEKKQNGLLQTAIDGVETKSEAVQTMTEEDARSQYGRKYLGNRGFSKHTDWYDTGMDLPKMKKLEINVPEDSIEHRHRFVHVKNGSKLQSPSITSTVHQQESPKEENEHEVQNASVPYTVSEKKKPIRPTDLPLKSPVERINDSLQKSVKSRFYFGSNMEEPKSPNDPGYVLHTASRWEEPISPQNGLKHFKRSQV